MDFIWKNQTFDGHDLQTRFRFKPVLVCDILRILKDLKCNWC